MPKRIKGKVHYLSFSWYALLGGGAHLLKKKRITKPEEHFRE